MCSSWAQFLKKSIPPKRNLNVASCFMSPSPKMTKLCASWWSPTSQNDLFGILGYVSSPTHSGWGFEAVCQADLPRDKVLGIGRRNWTHQSCSDLKSPTKGVVPLHCAASLFKAQMKLMEAKEDLDLEAPLGGGGLTWDGRTAQNLRCLACLKNQRPSHWWNIEA